MKNNKGITLIALVITIIILLIIAGISIVALTGDNGLFTRAMQAKENTLDSQNAENLALDDYDNRIDEAVSGTRETVIIDKTEYDKLRSLLSVKGNVFKDRPDTWTPRIEYSWKDGDSIIYGQRFMGTLNTQNGVLARAILMSGLDHNTTKLLSWGGYYKVTSQSNFTRSIPGSAVWYDTCISIKTNDELQFELREDSNNTNLPYDIWVLYAKN